MITSERPPRPAPSPQAGRSVTERLAESPTARAVVGAVLAIGAIVGGWVIVMAFTGHFTDIVSIDAQLPTGSNAVPAGTPVEYRNVTVGKVSSLSRAPGGGIGVRLSIYPHYLGVIPSGVEAQVQPLSIFGNQYVDLVPPSTASAAHLAAHDSIAAYSGASSSSLQGTVTQLDDLLDSIHPAQLDTALTALATALNGEGQALGSALSGTATFTGEAVVPNLSTLEGDIRQLPATLGTVNTAAPQILGTIGNASLTARTLTEQESALRSLLSSGTTAVGQTANLLRQVETSLPTLVNDSGPLLADVTHNPHELSQTLSGLTAFASAVAAGESHGPYLSLNATIPIANINEAVDATLGYDNPTSIDEALGSAVNPTTYSSADCPEYPGETNPYCSGDSPDATAAGGSVTAKSISADTLDPLSSTASSSASTNSGASGASPAADVASQSATDPYATELAAAEEIASALGGGQTPAAPGFADLVLLPLLSGVAQQ